MRSKIFLILAFLFTCDLYAATTDGYLVIAGGKGYKTDFKFTYPTTTPNESPSEHFDVSTCFVPRSVDISPLETKRIEHVEALQCREFSVLKIAPDFTQVESLITFQNVTSAYFVVPLLHISHSKAGDYVTVWGVVNDDETSTDLAFFNLNASLTSQVRVSVYENNSYVTTENVTIYPGLTFYRLKTKVFAGRINIIEGSGLGPESPDVSIVGFAAIGNSGAPEVIPFK